jgi:hypothetical protein
MLLLHNNKEAQGLTDYVILLGIITAALVGGQTYLKRGIQNSIKYTADDLSNYASTSLNLDAQTIGAGETGLVTYTPTTPEATSSVRKITINEYPAPADPIRKVDVTQDLTTYQKGWKTTSELEPY